MIWVEHDIGAQRQQRLRCTVHDRVFDSGSDVCAGCEADRKMPPRPTNLTAPAYWIPLAQPEAVFCGNPESGYSVTATLGCDFHPHARFTSTTMCAACVAEDEDEDTES